MAIRIGALLSFGIILSTMCSYNTNAYGGDYHKCDPGCFCVFDGKYPAAFLANTTNICGYNSAQRLSCGAENTDFVFDGGYQDLTLACTYDASKPATYYFNEFYEVYTGVTGMYGFIGEDLIVMPTTGSANKWGVAGIYQCPVSYPSSDAGAKTLWECYKRDKNGNKVYYSVDSTVNYIGNNDAKTLAVNLQNTVKKATQIAHNLQRVSNPNYVDKGGLTFDFKDSNLDSVKTDGLTFHVVEFASDVKDPNLESAKKAISAGVSVKFPSDSSSKETNQVSPSDKSSSSEKNQIFKTKPLKVKGGIRH